MVFKQCILHSINLQMYRLALLQCVLQVCRGSDFAAESLLKYKTAADWNHRFEEATGDSHKYGNHEVIFKFKIF